MEDASIYIDDNLCGTVNMANSRPTAEFMQYVSVRCAR